MTPDHTRTAFRDLLTQLTRWRAPLGPIEAQSWERFDQWLANAPADRDLTDQTLDTTHVTSSAMVMADHAIVLHKHKRLNSWIQPGGHVDPGETLVEGAVRETFEETGLHATALDLPGSEVRLPRIISIDAHEGGRGHFHYDIRWLCYSPQVAFQPGEGESQAIRWVTAQEGIDLSESRSIQELLNHFLTNQDTAETMLQQATTLGAPIRYE